MAGGFSLTRARVFTRTSTVIAITFILTAAAWSVAGATQSSGAPLGVADGFTLQPFTSIPGATTAATFHDGDLYATTLTGTVVRVPVTWTDAGPVAGTPETVVDGLPSPLGLAFHGDAIIVSGSHGNPDTGRTDGILVRVDADGSRTIIVDGLPNGRHNTNHLEWGPDGRLYFTNGNANDNGIQGGPADVFPYSGAVLSVDVDEVTASPAILRWVDDNGDRIPDEEIADHAANADFNAKVHAFAHGFRNPYGFAFNADGDLYVSDNGADDPDTQDLLHRVEDGAFHGFPFCVNTGPAGGTGDDVTVSPSLVFPDSDCGDVTPASALLGWHICATGVDVPTTGGAAAFPAAFQNSVFVAECGPFFVQSVIDKTPDDPTTTRNTGHKVTQVVLDENGDAVEVRDFVTGLSLPTDVVFGPDGALYAVDVEKVVRVAPVGQAAPDVDLEVPVLAAGNAFTPAVLTVPAGTTVTWKGVLLPHTVTSARTVMSALNGASNGYGNPDSFAGYLPPGGSFSYTFDEPGTYPYFCQVHYQLGMVGTIVVT